MGKKRQPRLDLLDTGDVLTRAMAEKALCDRIVMSWAEGATHVAPSPNNNLFMLKHLARKACLRLHSLMDEVDALITPPAPPDPPRPARARKAGRRGSPR